MKSLLWCAACVALLSAQALAIPGQTTAQFIAWAKNADLGKLEKSRDEMSGGTVYHAIARSGSTPHYTFYYSVEPAEDGIIHAESLALQGVGDMETYDIRKHKKIAMSMLSWVYGATIAIDFAQAKLVGDYGVYQSKTRRAIYRGGLYGYELSGIAIEIMRLQDVQAAARSAEQCSRTECGD